MKRLIRLYPLALLGAALGLAVLLLKWHAYPAKVDTLPRILVSGALNAAMLPTVFGGDASRHELFPGNGPLWTLFFEMVANMLWAWRGVRMQTAALSVFALVSFGVMAVLATAFHTVNMGFDVATIWGGLARVCFGFPLGVIIYRLHAAGRLSVPHVGPVQLAAFLLFLLAFPSMLAAGGSPLWDLASVLILLPAIVVLGLHQSGAGRTGRLLGDLSYPVYVLHFPVLLIASGLHQSALSWVNVHLLSAISVGCVLILGAAALHVYDAPARQWLSRRRTAHPLRAPESKQSIPF